MDRQKKTLPLPVGILIVTTVTLGLLAFQRQDLVLAGICATQFGLSIYYGIKWTKE
ncbi:hypothetical protein KDAU_03270 [Dictyobacter aurantiacus]|uniref:Uncharacterized protein n=1 Tax=Dictyobacter aurantiacus TaxID=1936993 RepID=A0A401Z858_9CHLR|nr:hypothetical protein KDAU_03270 [Dictyobacter aurantiacus]